ncbi:hypothetical protein PtB15_4B122 [Puccinia triticina]|nr:hypothetical protein PtB15_4B122 [Puccinia triticina]
MQLSLPLVLISCHIVAFSASMPLPQHNAAKESCTEASTPPSPSHARHPATIKAAPTGLQVRLSASPFNCPPRPVPAPRPIYRRHAKSSVAQAHFTLKRVRKVSGRKQSNATASNRAVSQSKTKLMTRFNFAHIRRMSKRSPDSPLAGLLGSLSSSLGSLPVVGVPLGGLLSTLPTNALAAPGAVSGLLGTVTGAAQNAPVLGDLLKLLPLSALLKGNPIDSLKGALSGVLIAIPVLGGPLGGLANVATGAASALPISLLDMRTVSPINAQSVLPPPEIIKFCAIAN